MSSGALAPLRITSRQVVAQVGPDAVVCIGFSRPHRLPGSDTLGYPSELKPEPKKPASPVEGTGGFFMAWSAAQVSDER